MDRIVVQGLTRLPTFSHATIAGDTVYVAGCVGTLPDSMELAPGGTGPETTQAIENIRSILDECGLTLANVAKVSVFLADISTFNEMNQAYLPFFEGSPPARITIGGVDLALGAAVEVECIAHKG